MSQDYAKLNHPARVRILQLLSDLRWHEFAELRRVGGVRYSARILELKRLGYEIEDEPLEPQGKRYRLCRRTPGRKRGKRVKAFLEEADARAAAEDGLLTDGARTAIADALGSFEANRDKL